MSRRVIICAKLCLCHPFSRIKWIRQWAVDQDSVLTSTTSAKIGKTAIQCVLVIRESFTREYGSRVFHSGPCRPRFTHFELNQLSLIARTHCSCIDTKTDSTPEYFRYPGSLRAPSHRQQARAPPGRSLPAVLVFSPFGRHRPPLRPRRRATRGAYRRLVRPPPPVFDGSVARQVVVRRRLRRRWRRFRHIVDGS